MRRRHPGNERGMMNHRIEVRTIYDRNFISQDLIAVENGNIREVLMTRLINLQDAGVRAALIKLGWTPPRQAEAIKE